MNDMTATIAAIEARDAARIRAVLVKDARALDELFAAELRYVHSSGADGDKDTYISKVVSGFYDYKVIKIVKRDFRLYGDVALVNGDTAIEMFTNGVSKKGIGRYLQVWIQRDGKWQMARWHAAPVP